MQTELHVILLITLKQLFTHYEAKTTPRQRDLNVFCACLTLFLSLQHQTQPTCSYDHVLAPSCGTWGHADLNLPRCGHLYTPPVDCKSGWWDAWPGSEGPADASGGVQTDWRQSDADSSWAEAGCLPPWIKGERDVCCSVPTGDPFLQGKASHPEESDLQTAAEDA